MTDQIPLPKLSVDEVLKIFTTVPKKFIDDFYKFTINKDNDSNFYIDVDKLSLWLDVNKYTILRMLQRNYQEGIDYIKYLDNKKTSQKANHKKVILLTSECMKRICMSSRSEKAETVRSYFIELEEFIIHYNDQIVDGLMRDIQDIAIKDRSIKEDGPGIIYIIRAAPNVNKLGETMTDLIKRLSTYNTGRVKDVELLYAYKTTHRKEVEKCVKTLMKEKRYRKRRELYQVDWEIISKLIKGCARLSLKLDQKHKSKINEGKYYIIFSSDLEST